MIRKTPSPFTFLFALLLILGASLTAFSAATITIVNGDPAGVGFNDPTVVTPVGGNNGTTLGKQRLNAFQAAADKWGATLTSTVPIRVKATWEPLTCTPTTAVLGSAGAARIYREFTNAPFPGTWFSKALRNKYVGSDGDLMTEDITATFNVDLGKPGCFAGTFFYLGLDNNHGASVDLVGVLLHEFAHGLGFQTFTDTSTGAQAGSPSSFPSVFDRFLFDISAGKHWFEMTNAERAASAVDTNKLVWDGPKVVQDAAQVLGNPTLKINSPAAIAGNRTVSPAAFGSPLTTGGVTGALVQGLDPADGAGALITDGCSPFTNAAAVAGKLALLDRGTCAFTVKAANAQAAGAKGLVLADNIIEPLLIPSGSDPTITIPVVIISLTDGNSIKGQLGSGVNATLGIDTTVRPGADNLGRPLMYAPTVLEGGSSVSHWDKSAFPNQLMEPSNNADLTHQVTPPNDLTFSLLADIGWVPIVAAGPSQLQFSSSAFAGAESTGTATFTITRTGDTTGTSTVDYQTSDGSATQDADYEIGSDTLSFIPGETQKTITLLINQDSIVDPNETFNITLGNVTGTGATLGTTSTATVTITDDDTAVPTSEVFIADLSNTSVVPATNSTARAAAVLQLTTNDSAATISLTFTSPLGSNELTAGIYGPAAPGANGPLVTSLPTGNFQDADLLLSPNDVANLRSGLYYLSIQTSNSPGGEIRGQLLSNPMDEAHSFVLQNYHDFLARVPDADGLAFWTKQITDAGTNPIQLRNKRVEGSNAFFFEQEFQQTGAYVFRLYRAAFGDDQPFPNPDRSNLPESAKLPSYTVFSNDRARVVGGTDLTQGQIDLANQFVQRTKFTDKYPLSQDAATFVDAVLANIRQATNVDLTSQRTALITLYTSSGRGAVLYRLADDNATNPIDNHLFIDEEYNRAFVATQYFGYLRRDADIDGFLFWLNQVNRSLPRDVSRQHAMVCSFITSKEYQERFSPVISRFNSECPQ